MTEKTANKAEQIIDLARKAKAFQENADVELCSDEGIIRAAVAYNMLVRNGVITAPRDDLDMPHSIATIAANFDDRPASTPERAALFATRLATEDDPSQDAPKAREAWARAPEGFDGDRDALHARFPEGYIIVKIQQGRTPGTPDSLSESYREVAGVTLYGVELRAAMRFAEAEAELVAQFGRVPSGSFEAVFAVTWREELVLSAGGGWLFVLWREGGEVVYHAFTGNEGVPRG